MQVKSLTVGNSSVKNNIFLAPMAGYTDYAYRHLQLKLGIGLAFTELVSAKGLVYGGNGSNALLYSGDDQKNTVAQLFGADEYFMRSACESEYLKDFDIVDINMGCPVPKVFKNGEGSALLTDIKKAERIIKECVKSGKTITIKIRTGIKAGDDIATDYAAMAEQAGAKLITIHGRVRDAYYSGEPDFGAIERAKNAVQIPVIANGGIFTVSDANQMIEKTGVDGIMLARGALANPFLILELLSEQSTISLKEYMKEHIQLMASTHGDRKATVEFRKFPPYYFKGLSGMKEIKNAINQAQSVEQIIGIIEQNL